MKAIQASIGGQLGLEWYEAEEHSFDDAKAKFNLDLIRNRNVLPENPYGQNGNNN